MLYVDVECFHDYFLISFLDNDGRVAHYEMYEGKHWNPWPIKEIMLKNTTVGFNSNHYDLLMIAAAIEGRDNAELKALSDRIIKSDKPAWEVVKEERLKIDTNWDHIDIINVIPGQARLKIYAARIGQPRLQDLPYHHNDKIGTPERRKVVRDYCHNDVRDTKALFESVAPQIKLRKSMSEEYGMDLRSKSDAQIAEAVMRDRMGDALDRRPKPTKLSPDYRFKYRNPGIIEFDALALRKLYARIMGTTFTLSKSGSVANPEWLAKTTTRIGTTDYSVGIGGLHSCESAQTVRAGSTHLLMDFDVASYYPSIILQQGVFPKSLGKDFLTVFNGIVEERLVAKRAKDKVTADTLKIVVNGTYGKLGSKYSVMYSPDLLAQTTLTGQLSLLMLIERMEKVGAKVVSANTDGIVVLAPKALEPEIEQVVFDWELDTSYELERNDYAALYSRDVNNYIAVKTDGSVKRKGVFAEPGLSKNPAYVIVADAVAEHVSGQGNYEQAIRSCRDIKKFVMVRTVNKGGAVWRGEHLGKAVRFYKSTEVGADEAIRYADDDYKVPTSDACRPVMELPDEIPTDVDFDWYVAEAEKTLKGMGYA